MKVNIIELHYLIHVKILQKVKVHHFHKIFFKQKNITKYNTLLPNLIMQKIRNSGQIVELLPLMSYQNIGVMFVNLVLLDFSY